MDDIVERLRWLIDPTAADERWVWHAREYVAKSADEIIRLRAEVEALRAEVEALRAMLNEAWPYVGSNLQERIDAAIDAQKEE